MDIREGREGMKDEKSSDNEPVFDIGDLVSFVKYKYYMTLLVASPHT